MSTKWKTYSSEIISIEGTRVDGIHNYNKLLEQVSEKINGSEVEINNKIKLITRIEQKNPEYTRCYTSHLELTPLAITILVHRRPKNALREIMRAIVEKCADPIMLVQPINEYFEVLKQIHNNDQPDVRLADFYSPMRFGEVFGESFVLFNLMHTIASVGEEKSKELISLLGEKKRRQR